MSDAPLEEHSSLIKTPKQLAAVVLAGFLVPVLGIVLLIELITGGLKVDSNSPAMSEEAIAQRLKPVGEVAIGKVDRPQQASGATTQASAGAKAVNAGEQIYNTVCQACHGAGVLGAPKMGDKEAWQPRLAQGMNTLYEHSIKGIRAMPPKGGAASASDADIKAAVDYIVGKSR
jgi:cytochrome c5